LRVAIELLEDVAAERRLLAHLSEEEQRRLIQAAGVVFNPDLPARRQAVKALGRHRKAARVRREDAVLDGTGIRTLRRAPVFTASNALPPPVRLEEADGEAQPSRERARVDRRCYICKEPYSAVHHFYDQLCPPCAENNFAKRTQSADLSGRVALLTGGRVKIGYQAGLKLLRAGAQLVVTTRFPRDSANRYAQEPDFETWQDRLEIFGLDLRHTPSVEAFCLELSATRPRLDFIINNACQTVRRPPEFYRHMMAAELSTQLQAPGLIHSAQLSQVRLLPDEFLSQDKWFPDGQFDADLQQVDLREHNSWRLLLAEVPSVELLEVHLVNAIAPFILNARLKPLMLRTPGRDKHIVNVSAVEGQFYRNGKTTRHPHTNMAKAALNMMTRTSAADYLGDGIHMNSVDTGWVTDEDPAAIAARKAAEQRFHPPLDVIDGAARILDPIFSGANTGNHVWGMFLKDYRQAEW
jgi:NAD(P)-dependent dehydrogenase (short-subunit alcohol dehydrogenase family)